MTGRRLLLGSVAAILIALSCSLTIVEAQSPLEVAGRRLADVLREYQRRGVKLVFSTELVPRTLRVLGAPQGADDREKVASLLRPHGLELRLVSKGTLLVVRASRRPQAQAAAPVAAAVTGVVVDARTAEPLPGVLVRVSGTPIEQVTDAGGRFALQALPAGTHRLFVSMVGYALAEPAVTIAAGVPVELTVALADGASTYTEEVNVVGDRFRSGAATVPSALALNSADVRELRGVLTEDPFRAVQALPGVTAVNDLRSEFAIRGSDFRHVGISVDGLSTSWPVHAVRGDWSGGSVGLVNSDVLDSLTLLTGAYPQEQPARTGGWLELSIREGSRVRPQFHGSLSMTSASLLTEGPIGSAGRGSWLVAARQSFVQWIVRRANAEGTAFGFSDLQSKMVYDVTPRQQLQFLALGGRSLLDLDRADADPNLVVRGALHSALFALTWRAQLGTSMVLTQKVAYGFQGFENDAAAQPLISHGSGRDLIYRGDAKFTAGSTSTFHLGGQFQSQRSDEVFTRLIGFVDRPRVSRVERIDGRRRVGSMFVRATTSLRPWLSVEGGAAVTRASGTTVGPWGAGAATAGGWTLRASTGLYRQLPDLDQAASSFGGAHLRPERSRSADIGLERRLDPVSRVQLLVFDRREADVLRLEGDEFSMVDGMLRQPSVAPLWRNALSGRARGVELLVQRRAAAGTSGWISYAWSRNRHADTHTGETYAADFDQRHVFTAYAAHRLSPVTSLSGRLRIASPVPIAGYLERAGDIVRIGTERNLVRVPTYARLDLRANRAFNWDAKRLTLFVEVINTLARGNVAPACACGGWTDSPRVLTDGRAIATTQRMFPFLPTAGIVFDF